MVPKRQIVHMYVVSGGNVFGRKPNELPELVNRCAARDVVARDLVAGRYVARAFRRNGNIVRVMEDQGSAHNL
jgi:hypothetical protein